MRRVTVSWDKPTGRQWGHPFYPRIELYSTSRTFKSYGEGVAFAEGLIESGARNVKALMEGSFLPLPLRGGKP